MNERIIITSIIVSLIVLLVNTWMRKKDRSAYLLGQKTGQSCRKFLQRLGKILRSLWTTRK